MKRPLKLAVAFMVLYLLAVCTPYGQSVENAMIRGFSSETWISGIRYSIGPPPLRGEEATLVVGIVLIVLIAVLRRQWRLAVAGAFVPAATAVSTFVLNRFVLPRPEISGAPESLTEVSFPSGHVAITAGVAIGVALVCGPRARPYAVAAGATWLAFVAAAVQNLSWHRPSDVIGATLLAGIWYLVAVRWLPAASKPALPVADSGRAGVLPVLVLAAVGAVLGAGRTDYLLEAIAEGVVGLLCAVILWSVASEESRCVRRRVRYSLGFFGRLQFLRTLRAPYEFGVVAVVLMLAIVSVVGVGYWRSHSPVHVDTARPEPAVITGPGTAGRGVTIGKAGATTNIDFYLDFRCVPCGEFEESAGATLDRLVADGTATLTYWPMTVMHSGSPQLATAFAVAAANGHARGFVRAIYDDPDKAWTDDQLVELGNKLGVPGFREALAANGYQGWLASLEETTVEREVLDLPTVFVNHRKLRADQLTPEGLTLGS
ncbi:thioredoxin domain-containing protein [Kribbella italica]|uniref:Membrane-associated phospholipid phosphatase n=1 Tax=Kribbella italica TaxID=1540520 RepID=A0A7W9MSF3_9ACTN|nr:thioredoxin domain-containing protein [Kribbella italica]MBB5834015.1 membrane-associated phospholipid phosphatase [Kribbella italica]